MKARGRGGLWIWLALTVALVWRASPAIAAESYVYDALGRMTDVTYANGSSIHYTYDANSNVLSVVTSLATAVEESDSPLSFRLGPVTPNPGSGARNLTFSIPTSGHVTLRVFDVAGREVATLMDRDLPAGHYGAEFATDRWADGVYFYRLNLDSRVLKGRMVVLR